MDTDAPKLETWGILELFGHLKLAGKITEQPIGGDSLIRIDVPPVTVGDVTIPAFTRFFGAKAVYSLTPCTEDLAKVTAAAVKHQPVQAYDLPEEWRTRIRQAALPAPSPDHDEWDGSEFEDEDEDE
jgi:hypothetical protein